MNVRAFTTALALALAISGCGRGDPAAAPPLAGAKLGGTFRLVDQDGRATTGARFAGRYRVFYFGYTYCPDVCPTTLGTLMAGYHQFAKAQPSAAARVVPVFVSVDPARDTPAVMKDYVAAFGPELIGLTGTPDEIARTARAYGTYYKAQPAAKGASGYLVDHSSQAVLYGPQGQPIALVPTEEGPDAVAATLAQWVR